MTIRRIFWTEMELALVIERAATITTANPKLKAAAAMALAQKEVLPKDRQRSPITFYPSQGKDFKSLIDTEMIRQQDAGDSTVGVSQTGEASSTVEPEQQAKSESPEFTLHMPVLDKEKILGNAIRQAVETISEVFGQELYKQFDILGNDASVKFGVYMEERFRHEAIQARLRVEAEHAQFMESQAEAIRKQMENLRQGYNAYLMAIGKNALPEDFTKPGAFQANEVEHSALNLAGKDSKVADWKPRVGFVDTSDRAEENMHVVLGDLGKHLNAKVLNGNQGYMRKNAGNFDILMRSPFVSVKHWEVASQAAKKDVVRMQGGMGELKRSIGDFYEMRVKGHQHRPK